MENQPTNNPRTSISLAQHYLLMKRPQDALQALSKVSPDELDSPFYWLLRGSIQFELDQIQPAHQSVQKGLTEFPDYTPLLSLGSSLHAETDDFPAAERMILAALQIEPENSDYLLKYAGLLIKGDQREKAQKIIDRVRQIDPENPKVKQIGAFNAYMEGDSQKATDLAKDHLRDNPEDILSHQFFGALQADQGNLASGERHLSSAAYLSGGQQDISAQARAIRIQSHWLLYPLRFVDRIGGSTIWVGTIVAYFVLRALELRQFATILALTYLTFAIYSWIAPPLLSRWFDYRYGQIR